MIQFNDFFFEPRQDGNTVKNGRISWPRAVPVFYRGYTVYIYLCDIITQYYNDCAILLIDDPARNDRAARFGRVRPFAPRGRVGRGRRAKKGGGGEVRKKCKTRGRVITASRRRRRRDDARARAPPDGSPDDCFPGSTQVTADDGGCCCCCCGNGKKKTPTGCVPRLSPG